MRVRERERVREIDRVYIKCVMFLHVGDSMRPPISTDAVLQ